jgi:ferredoxin
MDVEVDLAKCTGHGICESIAEDVFEVQDDGSVVIDHGRAAGLERATLSKAVTQCPAAALKLLD